MFLFLPRLLDVQLMLEAVIEMFHVCELKRFSTYFAMNIPRYGLRFLREQTRVAPGLRINSNP